MKTTNNLGLKKIELTDSPPDITVQDSNWDLIDETLKEHEDAIGEVNSQLATTAKAEKAGGTATAITLTNVLLTDGSIKNFIVKADNNATATTINGKPLYKPNTTTAPKLKANTAVVVWYDATGDCFFIKASAGGGTAVAGDVLASKTFSNDDDSEITGTMPNNGAVNHALAINGTYNIPAGYHNGSGKVTQSITTKAAATITPGTTDQTIAAGQYLSGVQTIKGDANLLPENILKGKSIFGKAGTLDHTDIAGQNTASGKCYEAIAKGDLVTTRRYFGFDTPVDLANPSTLPTGTATDVAFSSDGLYMAVTHYTAPYITIYKWNGTTYVKLTNPSTLPVADCLAVSFSPNGDYLACSVASGTPKLIIYKRSGDTFAKLSDPANLPGVTIGGLNFSSDGVYLAAALDTSVVYIYKRSGDTFTKLSDIIISIGAVKCAIFSPDTNYLAVGKTSSTFITVYKRSGDTFSELTAPAAYPNGTVNDVAWSSDGIYMAVGYSGSSPYLYVYKRSGDTFTKLTSPTSYPAGNVTAVSFSPDGVYLAVGIANATPYINIYKRSGDTFTKLTNPSTVPAFGATSAFYNPVLPHLAFSFGGSPYIKLYQADILGDYLHKYNSFTDFYYSNYINFGYAKAAGAVNATIDITTLPIK
ncbi:MAG: WD40 repeat domain-containing protein [Mobilitalea sp.]